MDNFTRLARRLSKQETVTLQSHRPDVETSEPISAQESESPALSQKVRSTSETTTDSTVASSSYETAAVEPIPFAPLSPTPTNFSSTTTVVPGDDGSDDEGDDDDSFLLAYYRSHGETAFADGKYERAEVLLNKALAVASGKPSTTTADGTRNRRTIADSVSRHSSRGLEANRTCVELCVLICRCRRHQGKPEDAGMMLAQACRYVRREDGDAGQRLRSRIDLEAVRFYLEQGKFGGAEECCDKGLKAVRKRMRSGSHSGAEKEDEELYSSFLEAKIEISAGKGENDEADAYRALLAERRRKSGTDSDAGGRDSSDVDASKSSKTDDKSADTTTSMHWQADMTAFMDLVGRRDLLGIRNFFRGRDPMDIKKTVDESDNSFFHYAVARCTFDIEFPNAVCHVAPILYLVNLGVPVDSVSKSGLTAADNLLRKLKSIQRLEDVERSEAEILTQDRNFYRLLQALSVSDAVFSQGYGTLVHDALRLEFTQLAGLAIDLGADCRSDQDGEAPIDIAVRLGLVDTIERLEQLDPSLLRSRANPDIPLICKAAERGLVKFVKWLLDTKRSSVHDADTCEWTALHHACFNHDLKMVILLMRFKPDVNKLCRQKYDGRTLISISGTPAGFVNMKWNKEEKEELRGTPYGAIFLRK